MSIPEYTTSVSKLKKWQYPFTKMYWQCLWWQLLGKINPKTVTYHAMNIADDDPIMDLLHDTKNDKRSTDA